MPVNGPVNGPLATPLQRALTSVGRGFHPASLFGATTPGVVYDLADASSLFQDSAATQPVTTAGQLIGRVNDKSGRGNHATQGTTASKLVWQTTYGQCDGVDDWLQTGSIDFTGTDKVTVIAGIRKESDAAIGAVFELSTNSGGNSGTFALFAPNGAGVAGYGGRVRGTAEAFPAVSSVAAPNTAVVSLLGDIAGDVSTIRYNGASAQTLNTDLGTGNFGNYSLYIGRRAGSSLPFNGRIYRLIVIGRALTASELSQAERWSAQPMGIAL
jgi:hypothetical protein